MRDWRGIRAEIGDRVFYATADGVRQPKLREAWVEEVGETHIRVRPTASPFGEMIGNDTRFAGCIGPNTSLWSRGTVLSDPGRSARVPSDHVFHWSLVTNPLPGIILRAQPLG